MTNGMPHIWNKLANMLDSIWGWLLLVGGSIFNVLLGYKVALAMVAFVIFGDLFFGIGAARKQGKYAQSELVRATINKVGAYYFVLIVAVFIEQVITWDWFFVTNTLATIIVVTEVWSISGNILIINPNAPFFRLMRSALIGEIARKLGRTEEQVKEAFEESDKESK